MKLRIEGTPEELEQAKRAIFQMEGVKVNSISRPYPNRNDRQKSRIYAEIEIDPKTN